MPDARTHDALTVATGAALAPVTYSFFSGQLLLAHGEAMAATLWLVGAHMVSGILFSPDLDLDSAIDNRWGIFHWIWRPYMWALPHRHFWSHSLIFAPLLRLAYFYFVVSGLLFLWVWLLAQLGVVVPDYHLRLYERVRATLAAHPETTVTVLVGFCTGSAVHSLADWLVTGGRRFLRLFGVRVVRDYGDHDDSIHRRRRRARRAAF
ncbi:MAG TPA: metal-binding protein [Chloroflexaceae bacterium]|nr:metal-binding protein [Chloroflexaceae bacterium]